MIRIETLLEQRARDWEACEPGPPPLTDFVARATAAPRTTSRRLMPALAAAAIVVVAAVSVLVVRNRHDSTATHPESVGGLTASQRSLAIRIALREAAGSNPNAPGLIQPLTTWPRYVDTAAATVLPYGQARNVLDGNRTSGTEDTLVVRITGRFAVMTSGPSSNTVTGNVVTALVPLATGQTTDGGVDHQSPPRELPHQTLLFQRFPERSAQFVSTPSRPQDLSSADALTIAQHANPERTMPPDTVAIHGILTDTANDQTPVWAFRYHSCETPHAPANTKNPLCTAWVFLQSQTGTFVEARWST